MKDLTEGNIYKTFFLFGFPLVLSGLLSQMYSVIDTMIAGKLLGDVGLAAIGATAPLISFLSSAFWGFSSGLSMYIARLFGTKEYAKLKSTFFVAYAVMGAVCLILCVTMMLFYKPIFALLQIDESLYTAAREYFLFYMAGLLPIVFTNNMVHTMNALGISSFPLFMSMVSMVLNIGGNLLCVLVFKWGIKGLAIASVASACVVDVCYLLKLHSYFREMGVAKERVDFKLRYMQASLSYVLPTSAQQMVMYLASLCVSPLVNGIGASASASYSVVTRVYDINAGVYQNSARAVSNYTAQCMGKNKSDRIKKGVFAGLLQGIAFVTPFVFGCCIFCRPVCSLFFQENADPLTKEYAYLFARKYLPFIYLNLVCNLFHGVYRGTKAMGHLFATTLTGAIARLVFSYWFIEKMGMDGFYLGWVLSWSTEAAFSFGLYKFGRWLPKKSAAS